MKKLLKKLTVIAMAAMMVMAMGVTAFAAESKLTDGNYTADTHLYRDADLTQDSMGNSAMAGATIAINGDEATIVFYTTEITYMGYDGHLSELSVVDSDDNEYDAEYIFDGEYYTFTISDFPADEVFEGCSITGSFTIILDANDNVVMPVGSTGYIQLTNIDAV